MQGFFYPLSHQVSCKFDNDRFSIVLYRNIIYQLHSQFLQLFQAVRNHVNIIEDKQKMLRASDSSTDLSMISNPVGAQNVLSGTL